MNTTRSLLLALALGHGTAVVAQTAPATPSVDDALRPIAYLNGVTQDGLAVETAELARTIDALMVELQRNGFPEQSLAGLKQLVAQLGTVGGEDMAAIGERLRGLGEDPGIDARKAVTDAYIAQQAVEARLKTLAKKIAVRQLREETVRRLETLIARQLSVQRETRSIGTAGANDNRQQILVSDQRGIGEDLDGFFQTGETLLANLRESVGTNAPAATVEQPGFIDRINGQLLKTYASEALDRLQAASYGEAYARQNALLAELNKILQGILSSQTKEERLASALQQVAALKQEQNARDQAGKKPDAEEAQKAADEAKLLASKVAAVDPEAAKAVAEAQKALQEQADEAANNAAQNPPAQPEPASPPEATQPGQPEPGEQLAANDPAGQPQPGQPQPGEPEAGENSDGEANDGENTPAPPSEAAAALAAAEAALRQQLAAEQAREAAAQAQQMAQNGQTPPAGQQQSQQQQQQAQNAQQQGQQQPQQQGQSQDGQPSQGGQDGGYVENQTVDGADGPAQTVGALNRSEREAMASLQNERYPAEYAPWVQQYWRNLAQDQ